VSRHAHAKEGEGGGRLGFGRATRKTAWGAWRGLPLAGARGGHPYVAVCVRAGDKKGGGVRARSRSRHTEEDGVGGLVADGVRTGGTSSQPVAASAGRCHGAREEGNGAVRGLHVSVWACRGKEGAWLGPREQCRF
jgi:hypothetical protein